MSCFRLFIIAFFMVCFTGTDSSAQGNTDQETISVDVNGQNSFQKIAGIGINANTRSWNGKELQPALDLLLDSMNMTIWRVIVESVEKWEDTNDNNDAFSFNKAYYAKLYESPKFRRAWDMIAYLNKRGIRDRLMINFMAAVPIWMGGEIVKPEYEDEYVEMLLSFFVYARKTRHLEFGLVSLMNEPDIRKEGPTVRPGQYVRLLKKLITRMEQEGLGDIRYVGPDVAGMDNGLKEYIPLILKEPVIMNKLVHFGLHSYGGYYAPVDSTLKNSSYPNTDYWVTEWNAWCNGCDDGKLGEYNYDFADKTVGFLLEFLKNGATALMAWEGYDSYYEHHAPSPFSYWGMLSYDKAAKTYHPRKNFYAIQQVSRFVSPGTRRVEVSRPGDSLRLVAFFDSASGQFTMIGINRKEKAVTLNATLNQLPAMASLDVYRTTSTENVQHAGKIGLVNNAFSTTIPARSIFTFTTGRTNGVAVKSRALPEPAGWYSGDIHVHLNCGDGTKLLEESQLTSMMETNNLAVVSLLADMGNGEVKDSKRDLPKVNGKDAPQTIPGRIVHWDTEWHWDATYSNFGHQALGGHLVLLGLKQASQVWEESPYKLLDWAGKQHAVRGFAHMEYLNDSIQNQLNCCIPIDYPVEAALANMEFISEDVYGSISSNNGNYNSEATINAYYKLLNCGFRLGLAAGTDYPCNNYEPFGTLLTYVKLKGSLSYQKWIEGIRDGRTVVSRNAHDEFLDLSVNGHYGPGDEVKLNANGTVTIKANWTATKELHGRIEIVNNGKVIAEKSGTAAPGKPLLLTTKASFLRSGWICARRMDGKGHQTHTAAVYVMVNAKPIRASKADALFFVDWIDNILKQTAPGGPWSKYFTTELDTIKQRYSKARSIYEQIAKQSQSN
jgi:O-glycosyl hydrolase